MKKLIKTLKKKLKNFNPKLKEECGVFGISDSKDAAALTALGLHALQHRGQEGCGIVSFDGLHYFSENGLILFSLSFSIKTISPLSTSLINFAPIISKAHVSDERT